MRTRSAFFVLMLTIPLLVACGPEKAIVEEPKIIGVKDMNAEIARIQRLNGIEVEKVNHQKVVETKPVPKVVVAAATYQNKIIYAETSQQKKARKQLLTKTSKPAKSKKNTATPILSNSIVKDTVVKAPVLKEIPVIKVQPVDTLKEDTTFNEVDTIAVRDLDALDSLDTYSPYEMAAYVRPASRLKKFSVVVGSYDSLEKAYRKALKMEKAKYVPFIVKNEKGMYRVFVGTYNKRDDADIDVIGLELDAIDSWVLTK